MKEVILLALFMPVMAYGQIIENFESGSTVNWVQKPEEHWNADNTTPVSGLRSLHHTFDNADSGTGLAGMYLKNLHPGEGTTRWSFTIRYGCEPSSSNNWVLFLTSDQDPGAMHNSLKTNGYAVGVNQTGYDDILRLWKVTDGVFSELISSSINWQTDIGLTDAARIVIERTITGQWSIEVFRLNGTPLGSAAGSDQALIRTGWFVILYRYTSTRDRLFWFDDLEVSGVFYEDLQPPDITGCEATGKKSVLVSFSEEPLAETFIPSNFSLVNAANTTLNVIREGTYSCRVIFENEFANKNKTRLIIKRLCDRTGNCKINAEAEFIPFWPERGDIIISEIMADPSPAVSLPEKEYLELYNRAVYPVKLKDYLLSAETLSSRLPDIVMPPESYIIITRAEDTSLFRKFGRTAGLKSFPALTDGGRLLCLSDSTGYLLHGAEYSLKWYGNELKSEGGWSLELKDTNYPFYYEDNWTASVAKQGGTPGKANSVSRPNPDLIFEGITNVFPEDSVSAKINFSEPVFGPGSNTKSMKIDGMAITKIHKSDPLMRTWTVFFAEPFRKKQGITLTIDDTLSDFAGNRIRKSSFTFGIPEQVQKGDVVFNELLFNTFPGDPDYIELLNVSDKIVDISRLLLVSVNDGSSDTSGIVPVSSEKRCFLPGDYYAITTDRQRVIERYSSSDKDNIYEVGSMPSMPDNTGHLILYNRELDLIDEIRYDENMHFPLLDRFEGISLERVNQHGTSPASSLWHSASESSDWGTPGAPNSLGSEAGVSENEVVLSSTKISPDNNGHEDLLEIRIRLKGTGNVLSIIIFDETGSPVRRLANNFLAGHESMFIWDGSEDGGNLVGTGIYIVYITMFDETGRTRQWKKVCTVIRN